MNDAVEVVHFDKAAQFLEFLRPTNAIWGSGLETEWIFRGQSDASWPLIPSAWRGDARSAFQPLIDNVPSTLAESHWSRLRDSARESPKCVWNAENLEAYRERIIEHAFRVRAEHEAVHQFVVLADEIGYPVPMTTDFLGIGHFDSYLTEHFLIPVGGDYPPRYSPFQAFALAQHHGIRTRLLDWTRKPLIAAFFAAERYAKEAHQHECLSVWALRHVEGPRAINSCKVNLLTVPRNEHGFLHAQDGLFLWISGGDTYFLENGVWPSLEVAAGDQHNEQMLLRKITLPVAEARELLRLLWRERVSHAHLMPTYDSVTSSLKLRWNIEKN